MRTFEDEIRAGFLKTGYRDRRNLSMALERLESVPEDKLDDAKNEIALNLAAAQERLEKRVANFPKITYPASLPVSSRRDEIVKAIKENQVVIIAGETGSGKTTQIPKMCHEAGFGQYGMIGHTQPRRIAARAVASRIAEELGQDLGQSVGYKVRFSDVTSDECAIKLMTDGILLSETQTDRWLLNYDCIIIDEAHERSLNIDFLLGYLRRLLTKRHDLHLVITSATIDPQRFSRHFNNAPVIEVSGRTFPVEVIYAPPEEMQNEDDDDEQSEIPGQREAILRAFKTLQHDYGRGDTLVFLPGEREITETEVYLNRQHLIGVEVLPLYARLATSEQNKIFAQHSQTRIVLCTNIAETSLTVPGIRYVIDTGTARISRYSPRTKVQRLPIEKISQASANQRKGRCGRVSDGVCVRLYSETDFLSRPEFTDPEILRTNLASVILQMIALRLGDISKFPFIDPPDNRQVTDGMRLLEELGAIKESKGISTDEARLTQVGRALSRMPCDPRLGRMIIESEKYAALSEVLVIASALAAMDPREYPPDRKEQARALHHRFDDEKSDFLAYLNLYRYLAKQEAALSRSAFSRMLKKELISYLRVREWFDVLRQLRSTCRVMRMRFNDMNENPAHYEGIHQSLLSGLLSHVGCLDENERGIYLGARGIKFTIHPSSALCRKKVKWVCAAELSETSKLFARTVAEVDPRWIERAAGDLVKYSYSEPHWSKKAGAVEASLKVTLYGLTLADGRKALYTKIDPKLCRELFIRDALVGGDISREYPFLKRNNALVESVEHDEDKLRRRDMLVDESVMEEFYSSRLPDDIVTQRHFEKWWSLKSKEDPHYLDFSLELITKGQSGTREDLYPEYWQCGNLKLKLSYVFDPSDKADGVSVHVPLAMIGQLRQSNFEWQIPGLREDLMAALIKSLPKRLRRNLIPAPDYAHALMQSLGSDTSGSLFERCAKELTRMGGEIVTKDDFERGLIPKHLFMNFIVENSEGKQVAEGRSLEILQSRLSGKAREALKSAVKHHSEVKSEGSWRFGTIKPTKTLKQGGVEITSYPALADHGKEVSLELFDSKISRDRSMWKGERRLLFLSLRQPVAYLEAHLPNRAKLAMYYQKAGSVQDLIADIMLASVDRLMAKHGGVAYDQAGFERLLEKIRGDLNEASLQVASEVEQILMRAHKLKRALKGNIPLTAAISCKDIGDELDSLVYPGFVSATSDEHLKEIPRYLDAAMIRLEKIPRDVNRDRDCMRRIAEVNERLKNALSRYRKGYEPKELIDLRWMVEELRVSYFAQQLGVRGQVSDKRIIHEIDRILSEDKVI
ncbi:MAG: ATP-dependent RNA helicase HrpA [Succinatimonas hippei]|nr:ATP-dependent RNA helicase HrpA [Succinatimonas hippei]